jgi:hypothetical protein
MPDGKDPFDTLLARMPAMAEAVAAFPEAVQPAAFEALMAAAKGTTFAAPADASGERKDADHAAPSPKRTKGAKRTAGSRRADAGNGRSSAQPKLVKDLNLRPGGKQPFAEFAAEKNPTNQHDRHVVAVYYLVNVAAIAPVSRDHVFTVWREMGWKLPTNFSGSLRETASKKRFIDTSDPGALRLLHPGVNRVEHDLPVQKKG